MKTTLVLLLLSLGAAPTDAPKKGAAKTLVPESHRPDDGRCEGCHTVKSWRDVVFPHDKTGFPLTGQHAKAGCRTCHTKGYSAPVSRGCGDCHRDAHAGQLGRTCDGCHDANGWRGAFSPEDHRRTNFPLTGRHAAVSCRECHPVAKDTTFVRPTPDCVDCHAADVGRAEASGVSHIALNFSSACRMCHDTWRFQGARFAAHDTCFTISRGKHAGLACASCHSSVPRSAAGGCNTGTATCTTCHAKPLTDTRHTDVPGYRYDDRGCVQCHSTLP